MLVILTKLCTFMIVVFGLYGVFMCTYQKKKKEEENCMVFLCVHHDGCNL